jgi:hypothetical protein
VNTLAFIIIVEYQRMSRNVKAHLEHGEFIEHNVRAPLGIKSGGNLDQLPWNITNPAAVGFYNILVRVGDNAAVNINGQISTTGYWNGTIWVCGGVGYSPPLGTGNLLIWFGSTATSRAQLILQNTGSASLSQVAVYLVPMLSGSVPIMT